MQLQKNIWYEGILEEADVPGMIDAFQWLYRLLFQPWLVKKTL